MVDLAVAFTHASSVCAVTVLAAGSTKIPFMRDTSYY